MQYSENKDIISLVLTICLLIFMWNGAKIDSPISQNSDNPEESYIVDETESDEETDDEDMEDDIDSEEPSSSEKTGVADWDVEYGEDDENERIDDASSEMLSASTTSFGDTNELLDALGKTKVEPGIFNVKITFDAAMFNSDEKPTTQEGLDEAVKKGRLYKSAKLNEDGSVSFIMSKGKHNALLKSLRDEAEESFEKMTLSENNAFTKITFNDDMTAYKAYLDADTVGLVEGISSLAFYLQSGFYSIMSGKPVDDVTIEWINANTGETIETTHSKDLKKKGEDNEESSTTVMK